MSIKTRERPSQSGSKPTLLSQRKSHAVITQLIENTFVFHCILKERITNVLL